jgi:hypothetical protein
MEYEAAEMQQTEAETHETRAAVLRGTTTRSLRPRGRGARRSNRVAPQPCAWGVCSPPSHDYWRAAAARPLQQAVCPRHARYDDRGQLGKAAVASRQVAGGPARSPTCIPTGSCTPPSLIVSLNGDAASSRPSAKPIASPSASTNAASPVQSYPCSSFLRRTLRGSPDGSTLAALAWRLPQRSTCRREASMRS